MERLRPLIAEEVKPNIKNLKDSPLVTKKASINFLKLAIETHYSSCLNVNSLVGRAMVHTILRYKFSLFESSDWAQLITKHPVLGADISMHHCHGKTLNVCVAKCSDR